MQMMLQQSDPPSPIDVRRSILPVYRISCDVAAQHWLLITAMVLQWLTDIAGREREIRELANSRITSRSMTTDLLRSTRIQSNNRSGMARLYPRGRKDHV